MDVSEQTKLINENQNLLHIFLTYHMLGSKILVLKLILGLIAVQNLKISTHNYQHMAAAALSHQKSKTYSFHDTDMIFDKPCDLQHFE